mgnify:FL=1
MSKMTFGELQQQSIDICIDDQSTSYTGMTDTLTFIKREINNAVSDIFTLMKEYRLEPPPKTINTVANKIYYPYPPGLMKPRSFTVDIGTLIPPLKIVQSQKEWDWLQQMTNTSTFPTHIFPRRDDFGIYPTPTSVQTVTIVGSYQPTRMTRDDYSAGVVTVTYGDETVTTSNATFTEAMVGSQFILTDSTSFIPNGNSYRIASFTSPQSIELSRTFMEDTAQGQHFVIGQSPEIPEELHYYIPYKVGSVYWHTRRHDSVRGQELANYFYTGDYNNTKRSGKMTGGILATLNDLRTNGRGSSNLIETYGGGEDEASIYMRNTIWGVTISDSQ